MKVRPPHDRIVLKQFKPQNVERSGIIIPDTAKEEPQQGEVVAVGNGKISEGGRRIPLEVKVGDQVMFAKYAGTEVEVDGEEYLILSMDDLLAVLE